MLKLFPAAALHDLQTLLNIYKVVRFRTSFNNTVHDVMKGRGWKETDSEHDWDGESALGAKQLEAPGFLLPVFFL